MPSSISKVRSKSTTASDEVANEQSRLIPCSTEDGEEEIEDEDEDGKSQWQLMLHEFWILLRGSLPVILAYTLQNSLQTFSVLIVGRLSPEALATAAFAYMFAMASGWLIALGGTTAIDTLASATFTGSKNPQDLGVILQRAYVVLGSFTSPLLQYGSLPNPSSRLLVRRHTLPGMPHDFSPSLRQEALDISTLNV